uniref:Uncharacterized protein n=1 Tax=Lepeophtheirus salmonis TaxID=72036 RepID=A0A0K2U882_LEPSM
MHMGTSSDWIQMVPLGHVTTWFFEHGSKFSVSKSSTFPSNMIGSISSLPYMIGSISSPSFMIGSISSPSFMIGSISSPCPAILTKSSNSNGRAALVATNAIRQTKMSKDFMLIRNTN